MLELELNLVFRMELGLFFRRVLELVKELGRQAGMHAGKQCDLICCELFRLSLICFDLL